MVPKPDDDYDYLFKQVFFFFCCWLWGKGGAVQQGSTGGKGRSALLQ